MKLSFGLEVKVGNERYQPITRNSEMFRFVFG